MQEILAEVVADIPEAWDAYYSELARFFRSLLPARHGCTILEVGAGKGQLTIPLLKRLPRNIRYIASDFNRGPYSGWLDELRERLKDSKPSQNLGIISEDARTLKSFSKKSVDCLVSNELLCDLTRKQSLLHALKAFNRVLRPKANMIHGEWCSTPQIDDAVYHATHTPSWNPDQLHSLLHETGFENVEVFYFDTTIRFRRGAAVAEVKTWNPSKRFPVKNMTLVKKHGIRIPPEHVIHCRKM